MILGKIVNYDLSLQVQLVECENVKISSSKSNSQSPFAKATEDKLEIGNIGIGNIGIGNIFTLATFQIRGR